MTLAVDWALKPQRKTTKSSYLQIAILFLYKSSTWLQQFYLGIQIVWIFTVCIFHCQLKQLGHSVDKVEFIVMGGTFMCLPDDYRDYFIRNLHDALSGHTSSCVDEAVKYVTVVVLGLF